MNFRYYQTSFEMSAPLSLGNFVFHHTLGVGIGMKARAPIAAGGSLPGLARTACLGTGQLRKLLSAVGLLGAKIPSVIGVRHSWPPE